MAVSYASGGIHFTGLGSDTDFDTMISELKKLESHQKNRFTLWQADWNRRIDAFQELNTAMLSLNSSLNSMNTMEKFLIKTATTSKTDIMTATASGKAQNSTNKVEIKSLATNASYTYTAQKFSGANAKVNPTSATQDFVYTYKGKAITVKVGANCTLENFIKQINSDANNPGVTASLVKDGLDYIFQFQGKDTGSSATLTIDPSSSQALAIKPPTEQAIATKFTGAGSIVNSDPTNTLNYTYNYNGRDYDVPVLPNANLQNLADAINAEGASNGTNVTASLVQEGGSVVLKIEGPNAGDQVKTSKSSQINVQVITNGATDKFSSETSTIHSDPTKNFVYKVNGTAFTVPVDNTDSLTSLAAKINGQASNTAPVKHTASVVKDGAGYALKIVGEKTSDKVQLDPASPLHLVFDNGTNSSAGWDSLSQQASRASSTLRFAKETSIINPSSSAEIFEWNDSTGTHNVSVPPGTTLKDFAQLITSSGHKTRADVVKDKDGFYLQLTSLDTYSSVKPEPTAASSNKLAITAASAPGTDWTSETLSYATSIVGFASASSVVNYAPSAQTFKYTYDKVDYDVSIASGGTLQDLVDAINAKTPGKVAASIHIDGENNHRLYLEPADSGKKVTIASDSSSILEINPRQPKWVNNTSEKSTSYDYKFSGPTASVNNSGDAQDFKFMNAAGQMYTVSVGDGDTLQKLVQDINDISGTGVTASINNGYLVLTGDTGVPTLEATSSRLLEISPFPSWSLTKQTDKWNSSANDITYSVGFNNATDSVNITSSAKDFIFKNSSGDSFNISVSSGMSLEALRDAINSDAANLASGNVVTASLETIDGKQHLKLSGASGPPSIDSTSSRALEIVSGPTSVNTQASLGNFDNPNAVINNTGSIQKFAFIYKGKEYTVDVAPNGKLSDLVNSINSDPDFDGLVKAKITEKNGKSIFTLQGCDASPETPNISNGSSSQLGLFRDDFGGLQSYTKEKNTVGEITTFTGGVVNNSAPPETYKFVYTNNGTTGSIDVPPGMTLEEFITKINSNKNMPGVYVTAKQVGTEKYELSFSGTDPKNPPTIDGSSSREIAVSAPKSKYLIDENVPVSIFGTAFSSAADEINSTQQTQKFIFEYQGKNTYVNVEPGEKLSDLVNKINQTNIGVRANTIEVDGKTYFQMWGTDPADTRPPQASLSSSKDLAVSPPNISSGGWHVQACSNAQIKLNDWPEGDEYIESESNSPNNIIDGVTLNLKDVGTSQVTINNDANSIKEQVVALVDALNTVRTLILQLSGVDTTKAVEKIGETASAFDAQMGSILTGNYGVQLLSSIMKGTTASQAQGFEYRSKDKDGLLHGDLFTSLSHVGITTVADKNSPNFGLLTIDEKKLDASLAQDAQSVAELFAADNLARVDSSDFSFARYISGATKPGVYKVDYEINSDGNPANISFEYNGKKYKGSYDSKAGELTCVEGPGQGLSLTLNNTTIGNYSGTVTLKMGKVGELASLTKDLNAEKGIVNILKSNYQQISKNIQKKIDTEDERLILWERTMRNKFARLEKVLASYNGLNKQLESTIKQLPSSKG